MRLKHKCSEGEKKKEKERETRGLDVVVKLGHLLLMMRLLEGCLTSFI